MIDKNDKDGTIKFLVERIKEIREAVRGIYTVKNVYAYDYEDDDYYEVENEGFSNKVGNDDIEAVVDLCDKTLMEVTF
jgi:hypothetical protein